MFQIRMVKMWLCTKSVFYKGTWYLKTIVFIILQVVIEGHESDKFKIEANKGDNQVQVEIAEQVSHLLFILYKFVKGFLAIVFLLLVVSS